MLPPSSQPIMLPYTSSSIITTVDCHNNPSFTIELFIMLHTAATEAIITAITSLS